MSLPAKKAVTERNPLTLRDVEQFAQSVQVGDIVPAAVRIWRYADSNSARYFVKRMDVKIIEKYPQMVMTDLGIRSWNELAIGYHTGGVGVSGSPTV